MTKQVLRSPLFYVGSKYRLMKQFFSLFPAEIILIEVTMAQGRTQTVMEIWPIGRHLGKFSNKVENAICYFVAPSIFSDSKRQIAFLKKEENKIILPKTIGEFIDYLENSKALYESP